MTKDHMSEPASIFGSEFTKLMPKEAFIILTTSATYFFMNYVDAEDFDSAWNEWGQLVRKHAAIAASDALTNMDVAGHA